MAKNDAGPLSKFLQKPELGLFVSDREKASATRAMAAVDGHVARDSLRVVKDAEQQLLQIARLYWAERAYDEAVPVADVREQVEPAVKKALATVDALQAFSKATKAAFISEMRSQRAFESQFIEKLVASLKSFALLASALTRAEGGSRSQEALKGCCLRLMKFREQMTGGPFRTTLTPKLGAGHATEAFQRPDPQFVLEIAHAIDPDIKFPAVRSAFVMLKPERSRKK